MPIVDGVYQAPTWVNNGPPAMDEVEMQAICDTVAQTGNVTTPAQTLGLTGDLSVGASLGVLATVGDLHVWRRTVSSLDGKPEVPAGYTLGGVQTSTPIYNYFGSVSNPSLRVSYADSVSVSQDGTVSLSSPNTFRISDIRKHGSSEDLFNQNCIGKFVLIDTADIDSNITVYQKSVFFVPEGSEFSHNGVTVMSATKFQSVTGYPYQPAVPPGTVTVDYPVSVNPNAYQTGSDAKPAGYMLGEVVNEQTNIVGVAYTSYFYYSDTLPVNEDGTVNVSAMTRVAITGQDRVSEYNGLYLGKFIVQQTEDTPSDLPLMTPVFIPQNATFTYDSVDGVGISKYQKVTTYPAIPAGNTIEYLGKLGDKSRMQIVSYVGTGRYGSGNPCSINADFPIRLLTFLGLLNTSGDGKWIENASEYASNNVLPALLTETPQSKVGFSDAARSTCTTYASKDKKTVIWYNSSASAQLNQSGLKYYFLCQG